ncbi:spherulation-specific family 4 protein [Kitasatospora purpeofusca]|uniref:spherulation-specific family 4 protein n=1 Tax=Kitasatospora purpeofusca TaxID=67352 RepID=UPI0035DDC17A
MQAGIPMYVHPGIDARSWAALATAGSPVRFCVLNQDNGPGATEDAVLYDAARAVRASTDTRVCGYIDLDYGTRDDFFNVQDAETWVARGIDCAFLDQVPATEASVQATALSVMRIRAKGIKYVVMNYGVLPHAKHLGIGDVSVIYEGDMATYRTMTMPAWTREHEPERLCHMVYETSQAEVREAVGLARQRGVHTLFTTDRTYASGNPWAGVPLYWADEAKALKTYPNRPAPGWTS